MEGSIITNIEMFHIDFYNMENKDEEYEVNTQLYLKYKADIACKMKGIRITVEKNNETQEFIVGMDTRHRSYEEFGVNLYYNDDILNSKITKVTLTPDHNWIESETLALITENENTLELYMWIRTSKNSFYPHICFNNIYTYPDMDSFEIGERYF